MSSLQLLFEALIVGVVSLILIYAVTAGLRPWLGVEGLPSDCKTWNKHHIMEVSIIISGMLFHILAEIAGVNEKYCRAKVNSN